MTCCPTSSAHRRGPRAVVAGLALGATLLLPAAPPASATPDAATPDAAAAGAPDGAVVPLILGDGAAGAAAARAAVADAGGRVTRRLELIDAHAAEVPRPALARLGADPDVAWLTPDSPVRLAHAAGSDPALGPGSLTHVADTVGASRLWERGVSGAGVDVAVIDSGVVPVGGLRAPGKVVNGPDLSFESGEASVRHLDTYGHGTHMAGIIAGRDDDVASPVRAADHEDFVGVAPDARVVNLKVSDARGATDVSQVIAAIDWVVQHGRRGGLDIRVLNLSFGTDGVQDYRLDPLAHAVEQAWHAGVVVVVAAGNDGFGDTRVNNPALNPYVIAVGGSDGRGTIPADDDVVADWSSRGDASRGPDLVAPGSAVVSLRDPGSHLDQQHPGARVGERFFRGSGTSQAAAVVSGAAALLLQQRPGLTPDQVKALLTSTATPLAGPAQGQGAGSVDVSRAAAATTPAATQTWPRSLGTGSLETARGSRHVSRDGLPLVGERTVHGTTWNSAAWASGLLARSTWSGGSWSGSSWTGGSWTGSSWTGSSWTGSSWTGSSWTGSSWTGSSWTGSSWTGNSWSSAAW